MEPPSTGHPKELLEDARAEPPTLVADGQRSPQELCWLATSLGWHRPVQDLTPPDLFTFPQRRLGAAERAKPSSLSADLPFPHLCEARHTQSLAAPSWGTSPPCRAMARWAGTACAESHSSLSWGVWRHREQSQGHTVTLCGLKDVHMPFGGTGTSWPSTQLLQMWCRGH